MIYKITISIKAKKDIKKAISYYKKSSFDASKQFILLIEQTYHTLELNPFFKVQYKNIRALKIKKFPYSIYFVIIEKTKTIKILACLHNKQNPELRPKL